MLWAYLNIRHSTSVHLFMSNYDLFLLWTFTQHLNLMCYVVLVLLVRMDLRATAEYIYYIWLSAKRCACKGLCTSVENKTLLKTVFIWNVVLCTCMNEWIYSTDNFSNQAVVDFKIQSSHTEKAPKNDRQKRTSMYGVIFVTLLTNKLQAHGETITDLYAENIVLYG